MNTPGSPSPVRLASRGVGLALARLRFFLLVGGVLLLIAYWPTIRHAVERLARPGGFTDAISSDTEYWCPMCPGVVSDWPSKCPVCHMTLVRRQKGEMTPLPDGVVARVQLSPYRVMLAGIHTSPVEYRRLEHEIRAGGKLERSESGALILVADLFEHDAAMLTTGMDAQIEADASPGETLIGRVVSQAPAAGRDVRVRIAVEDAHGTLRPGGFAMAHWRIPAGRLASSRRGTLDRWRDRSTVELAAGALDRHLGPSALGSLLEGGVEMALLNQGLVLAVPESAVIDTGALKVVFIESMPTMFDAVEVQLGRRCGDHYLVRGGLVPGQRVVTTGAVLLDAETRLNPSVAAGYFGAGSRPGSTPPPPGTLSPEERLQAQRQKICPVTEAPLDSMGGPVRVSVSGRSVYICCEGCREPLLKQPAKYLPRLEAPK